MTLERVELTNEAHATVKLHGEENVVLILHDKSMPPDEALIWGFPTIDEWRRFLKACLRFDERLRASDNEQGEGKP